MFKEKLVKVETAELFERLGIDKINNGVFYGEEIQTSGSPIHSSTPIDGSLLGTVKAATEADYENVMTTAQRVFKTWRNVPAPKRGEMVYRLGQALREHKDDLGSLISIEMGKIKAEGDGEVQEMIDICDYAVGLSRQLYGNTMHSERPMNRMFEQWHPLGILGLVTSFNFPAAVWAWNFAIASVCGDVTVWKPSSKTPLTAIACTRIAQKVLKESRYPEAVASLMIGSGKDIGERLIRDQRVPLISATGSTRMGKRIGQVVGNRLGRSILELGGNNAVIVTPNADLNLALQGVLFGAIGTAGQRCTSTRRLFLHESIYDKFVEQLISQYKRLTIGNPLSPQSAMGPLTDKNAVQDMQEAIAKLKKEGGRVLYGGEILDGPQFPGGTYVTPCIGEAENHFGIVQAETFAPILYIIKFKELSEAIEKQNDVPQGLSSAIFSNHIREVETFLSQSGSDCGIANVNTGTTGAEIGGAFGGEKETGGGRESGSDSWKFYMRRQTNNINWSDKLPLAQGIEFVTS